MLLVSSYASNSLKRKAKNIKRDAEYETSYLWEDISQNKMY